ncbi:MAG TPA: biotin carboxylase N-terminal domain-containing protein [Solirubrobacteraceae bacterium]|nr:biotin carboxylase N-terminal domain-containing protein [Solirubrobacteraceae bacterium]
MKGPILIANRGEIAVRIIRTARALGFATVAVFTAADRGAVHIDAADLAVEVPSYLDGEAIVAAARRAGADAVHPGYGFLSENAVFAAAVTDAGLTWIGPPAAAIELMGDKARAKGLAREAGVPVVPGREAEDLTEDELRGFCAEHGFPAVIKAVAGGGGKGMRVVRSEAEIGPALGAARREAANAFGDDRVLIERYLERPRHIEVQVLADTHGTIVHLGERECSLQRRHQKVIEEAPSPVVDAEMRARMGEAAVALARACDYTNAGTVEFIVGGRESSPGGDFFFLEMNTRLQVEHPVTELVYGVDLVAQQLHVAAGGALALAQEDLIPQGHAIEARLYAEDPSHGFLPATGTVRVYAEPSGPGVRTDSGIRAGSEVGTSFDPMLAKVIAHGPDRLTAIRRLDRALADLAVVGVATNAAFSRTLLARGDVRTGDQDTGLLERVLADLDTAPPEDLVPAAMLAAAGTADPAGPWRRALAQYGEARVDHGTVRVGDRTWSAGLRADPTGPDHVRITLDGVERRYAVAVGDRAVWIARDGHHLEVPTAPTPRAEAGALSGSLEAPMPGTVLVVHVENGDTVAQGDVLVVLESMKMELSITAPGPGVVAGLELAPGDRVALGQALVAVLPHKEDAS